MSFSQSALCDGTITVVQCGTAAFDGPCIMLENMTLALYLTCSVYLEMYFFLLIFFFFIKNELTAVRPALTHRGLATVAGRQRWR